VAPLLRDLILKSQYRSDYHNLARDFYEQCLPESSVYGRAVGFFSSGVFSACPKGFYQFFKNGGRMRIVTSHILSWKDTRAIYDGYHDRHQLAKVNKLGLLNTDRHSLRDQEVLSWLIAKDRVALKVALPDGRPPNALYHEKLGFFEDTQSNLVAFSGSANESYHAVSHNFEQIDVFRSWKSEERRRCEQKRRDFERLWENKTPELKVISFVEAMRSGSIEIRSSSPSEGQRLKNSKSGIQDLISGLNETIQIPVHIDLYDHQRRAVRAWLKNEGRGILEMATGSGKTITALSSAAKLYELIGPPLFIVIVCPYLHLIDQWTEEAKKFGLSPLPCAHGKSTWLDDFQVRLYNARTGARQITSAIVSNSTFRTDTFQDLLNDVDIPFLVIGDEVHNLGASNLRECLPERAAFRIGLSATPERWFDPIGSQAIVNYFGESLVHYTLEEALHDEVLCPYQYYPHIVELTESELGEYQALTTQIGRAFATQQNSNDELSGRLENLLIKRARLVATASNKLSLLRSLMRSRRNLKHVLVYCGDGRVEESESEEEMRQIRAVTRLLGNDLLIRVAQYTADTPTKRRREIRREFADGRIQCLVAIRCLDEGVDIPETEHAFILASTSNPRQFIQRRGRLLRRAPGKSFAKIHDFIVAPPEEHRDSGSQYYTITRRLFGNELRRVSEFAKLATNGPEAMGRLLDIRDQLNLLHLANDE